MKKIYALLLMAAASLSAMAEIETKYYWFYDMVKSGDTGKGLIYAVDSDNAFEYDEEGNMQMITPTDEDFVGEKEIQQMQSFNNSTVYAWAKPADGYQLTAWENEVYDTTTDEEGNTVLLETTHMEYTNKMTAAGYYELTVSTPSETDDDLTEAYPFIPLGHTALFGKVKAVPMSGMEKYCTVTSSKYDNDKGDQITLTATLAECFPYSEMPLSGINFAYWTNDKGEKFTENPLTVTVGNEVDTYTACFEGENIVVLDFDEQRYIPFTATRNGTMSEGIKAYRILTVEKTFYDADGNMIQYSEYEDPQWGYYKALYDAEGYWAASTWVGYTGEIPEFPTSYQVATYQYNYTATDAAILTGEGKQLIILQPLAEGEEPFFMENYMKGAYDGQVDIAELPKTDFDEQPITYYVWTGLSFQRTTTGIVPEGGCYLTLDAAQYPLTDRIYLEPGDEDEETAICSPLRTAAKWDTSVYNLAGQRLGKMQRGINIVAGKMILK